MGNSNLTWKIFEIDSALIESGCSCTFSSQAQVVSTRLKKLVNLIELNRLKKFVSFELEYSR
ncbi:hypothetical protein Lser_V15G11626 [Lactuca serriola]